METVRFFHCYKRGVDRVFIDHPLFLEKVHIPNLVVYVRIYHLFLVSVHITYSMSVSCCLQVWGKTESKIYGPTAGLDYKDNQLRFSLLCQAALEAPRVLNLNSSKHFSGPYGEKSISFNFHGSISHIHCCSNFVL